MRTRPVSRGRGYAYNVPGRFETLTVEPTEPDDAAGAATVVQEESARSIVNGNRSPDVPFDWSINSYRGCEHGCVYCFARPSHSYLGLSPASDFESRLYAKTNGAQLLVDYLARPGYRCQPINLGANTDPYQPIEKRYALSRALLDVFVDCRHPVSIVTKGTLIERDIDRLAELAERQLTRVAVSVPTLDDALKRTLEPRVPSAGRRLATIRRLTDAGVPVTVLVAPVIPAVTDAEIERIVTAAAEHGASAARYVLLRLPHELEGLFREWLETHLPLRAKHVMSLLNELGEGRHYDARFGTRQTGSGEFSRLLAARFERICRNLGLNRPDAPLATRHFRPPAAGGAQRHLPF